MVVLDEDTPDHILVDREAEGIGNLLGDLTAAHPIRLIKSLAEIALKELSPLFEQMYSEVGRPSIPPERLLKASLLMVLYTVRSERMFCEQLDYNLLFRWFLDLNWDEPAFDHSTFSRNRMRLLKHYVAGEFFRTVGICQEFRV